MYNWKAIFFMFLSAIAFAFMNIFIKLLEEYHPFQIVFFRGLGAFLISFSYIIIKGIPILGNQRKLMVGRSLVGLSSMILYFVAIKLIPLGTAVTLRYLAPIFAAILAVLILRERIKPIQYIYFIAALIGVVLLKGFDIRFSNIGLVVILGSAIFSGMVYVLLRAIGDRDYPVVVVNYFMFFTTLVGGLLSISVWKPALGTNLIILLASGFSGFFGQLFMTMAFQIESASKVAPLKYFESILVVIIAWIWFSEPYNFLSILGIVLILIAMILNMKSRTIGISTKSK